MKVMVELLLIVGCIFFGNSYALDQTKTGFFYPIGTEAFDTACGKWLGRNAAFKGCYDAPYYHIGVDMMTRSLTAKAYAIADGEIYERDCNDASWGTGNCALFIAHKTANGQTFTAIYGHLSKSSLPANNEVHASMPIGNTGPWSGGIHLHFGIFLGDTPPGTIKGVRGWGRMNDSEWTDPCTGNNKCTNGFVSPVEFIETQDAYSPSLERQAACVGHICWLPKTTNCESATDWFVISKEPVVKTGTRWATPTGKTVCNELRFIENSIALADNPSEALPDDSLWHATIRFVRRMLGKTANAQDIADALSNHWDTNTINIYTGKVVAGIGARTVYGTGQGFEILTTKEPLISPPDFVVNWTKLYTPWGDEKYKFGMNESFDTKAQSENKGDGSCPIEIGESDTITGHFYLSRGYKEDAHSGDKAWRRLDSTTTKCGNLKPGDTHTETKNTVIREWVTEPGIYNIVYCVDHPKDDHNNGGDHQEKHESNNCSTEAVFEVVADPVVNVDPRTVDFITNSLQFRGTPPKYAGDQAHFGAYVVNIGNSTPQANIRSRYSVQCPGSGEIYLADDGTEASNLAPGNYVWEENIDAVTLPDVSGNCTAYFRADYQNAVSERDETNNYTSLAFMLLPRPAPNLTITKFQDEVGCCTTNLGSRIKPDIWVKNTGPVAPASAVTVIYQIASPAATGGQFQTIGYGTIRPSELPPGGTDEDYMDGSWSIPKNNAWKNQWHTVRGCLRADGSAPTGDPAKGDICATYGRFSKK